MGKSMVNPPYIRRQSVFVSLGCERHDESTSRHGAVLRTRKEEHMPELIGIEECERLTAKQVHDLYRMYVSRSQVSLMTSFGFGRELVEKAEGAWIWTRDGRRILDVTGGVGVLNHGHNHPRILAARRRF